MGVTRYYAWLKRSNFKGVLRKGVPALVSSFSIDLNGLIHKSAQFIYAYGEFEDAKKQALNRITDPKHLEAQFHLYLANQLQVLLTQVQPKEVLCIAVDGVAPNAKIQQQRQRRFKSSLGATLALIRMQYLQELN